MSANRDDDQNRGRRSVTSAPPRRSNSNSEPPGNAKLVLVVEDDEKTLKLLGKVLQRGGYRAGLTVNGFSAVNLLKRARPDLILLDLRMPRMDGFQLLELLKQYQSSSEIPVIVLTGSSSPFDIDRALKLGVQDYLVKPISPRKLLQKIGELLR
ncbi:MAG: response regulator [Myxococcota bacterium]|nr:response regulator [Myxococcota bacterium]